MYEAECVMDGRQRMRCAEYPQLHAFRLFLCRQVHHVDFICGHSAPSFYHLLHVWSLAESGGTYTPVHRMIQ